MSATQAVIVSGGINAATLERVLLTGDLSGLEPKDRLLYYKAVCESVGLNPLTKPFDYLLLDNGKGGKKTILYTKKDCTDQLRGIHGVSVKILSREIVEGIYVVTSQASKPDGRTDESIGAVPLVKEAGEWVPSKFSGGKDYFQGTGEYITLSPEAKANAIMKAETKAKRRVTLSICGLGFLDESELDTMRGAKALNFDPNAGGTESDHEPDNAQTNHEPDPVDTFPADTPDDLRALWSRMPDVPSFLKICAEFKYAIAQLTGSKGNDVPDYYAALTRGGLKLQNDAKLLTMDQRRAIVADLQRTQNQIALALGPPEEVKA